MDDRLANASLSSPVTKVLSIPVLIGACCLATPAADLPRLASGIHFQRTNLVVRWKAPSHPWPKALWVYTVSPTRFSPTVISNLMAIGSFTEKDKKDYGTSGMVFVAFVCFCKSSGRLLLLKFACGQASALCILRSAFPRATPRPPQCDIKATPKRVGSQAIGTPRPPQCDPKAPSKPPQGSNKAPARLPQSHPGAEWGRIRGRNREPRLTADARKAAYPCLGHSGKRVSDGWHSAAGRGRSPCRLKRPRRKRVAFGRRTWHINRVT